MPGAPTIAYPVEEERGCFRLYDPNEVFPDWHDDFRIPTVRDDVYIQHAVTVDPNTIRSKSLEIAVQPRTQSGILSDRGCSIAALFRSAQPRFEKILQLYLQPHIEAQAADDARVDLKNLIGDYRSVLDYAAHDIANQCSPKPRADKVYFPIAKAGASLKEFEINLDRAFPGLVNTNPALREHLIEIQEFGQESWLTMLSEFINFNKHHGLSAQELSEFESVVIHFGGAAIRLGELGLRSVTICAGGAIRFVNSTGESVDLDSPCTLDLHTRSLPVSASKLQILREKTPLCRIRGHSRSVACDIWRFHMNVYRTANKIFGLLSD